MEVLKVLMLRKAVALTDVLSRVAGRLHGLSDGFCEPIERQRLRHGIAMEEIPPRVAANAALSSAINQPWYSTG